MEHEITIEERPVGTISAYRGICSCGTYRTPWRGVKTSAGYDAIAHLNDVERTIAYDIAP